MSLSVLYMFHFRIIFIRSKDGDNICYHVCIIIILINMFICIKFSFLYAANTIENGFVDVPVMIIKYIFGFKDNNLVTLSCKILRVCIFLCFHFFIAKTFGLIFFKKKI